MVRIHQRLFVCEGIVFYCDGACKGNPGKGSYAWIEITRFLIVKGPVYDLTTNSKMELKALLSLIFFIFKHRYSAIKVTIWSDSMYVVQSYNLWLEGWIQNKKKLKKIKHWELWYIIHLLRKIIVENGVTMSLKWVKAHANNKWNNMADRFCNDRLRDVA